jgi:SAM-dependent methyltransferase
LPEAHVFDLPHYRALDEARTALFREVLTEFKQRMGLRTALDAGCGLGVFSGLLRNLGFAVTAFDGRLENIEEASKRHPGIRFQMADLEDPSVKTFGCFDLVLCFGLLYHLENPFRCIRNLGELTHRLLVIESMYIDNPAPTLLLRDEGLTEDQGLQHIAFYPTESCLVKMLYRAGFSSVYRFKCRPQHPHFHASLSRHRARTLLAASRSPLDFDYLLLLPEPAYAGDPWATRWGSVRRFVSRPWTEKVSALRRRLGWSER